MNTQIFDYKKWADKRTLEAIEKIDRMHFPDAYAFALQQVNHMVIVEELFSSRLANKPTPHESTNTEKVPELAELKNKLLVSSDWYLNFISNLKSSSAEIKFTFADGKQGMMSVQEILFHIVNHGSYHRGNIAHALDLSSVAHPIDGYGIYIHEKEPKRRES